MGRLIDLTGMKFGRLVVLKLHTEQYRCGNFVEARWLCVCDCGTKRIVRGSSLRSGNSTSCGCLTRENTTKALLVNIAGKKFGRWTVLAMHPNRNRYGKALWLCRCDCGTERLVIGTLLRIGHSKSCGCVAIEKATKRLTTHGMSNTSIYHRWHAMKQRCYNPNAEWYCNYGARGIGIHQDWRDDFQSYYADVGDPPPGLTLDRVDNDGPYAPWNYKWATPKEQVANRRLSKKRK
jgi:hypothetical protein